MSEILTVSHDCNGTFYVYLDNRLIGKQYDFKGVLKQLKRESKHMKTEEYKPKIRKRLVK